MRACVHGRKYIYTYIDKRVFCCVCVHTLSISTKFLKVSTSEPLKGLMQKDYN